MSNSTPVDPKVIVQEPVVNNPIIVPPVPVKEPGKLKTALRHPIQTTKRHRVAAAGMAGLALGTVATLFLSSKKDEDDVEVDDNDSDLDELIALESNDTV